MVAIAIGNGALREAYLKDHFDELAARQVSTVLLLAFFTVYMLIIFHSWPLASARQAAMVGAAWLVLTLGFEFALGRLVSGLAWREVLAEYDLFAGRLWILVPLWLALAPYVFYRTGA